MGVNLQAALFKAAFGALLEIPLPAGKRIITLVNKQHGIKKSFAVMVTAGDTVKVIKDLTDLMK